MFLIACILITEMAAMIEVHHWRPIVPNIVSVSRVWIQISSWISLALPVSSIIFMPKFLLSQTIDWYFASVSLVPENCTCHSLHPSCSGLPTFCLAHSSSCRLQFRHHLSQDVFIITLRQEFVAPSVCCHVKICLYDRFFHSDHTGVESSYLSLCSWPHNWPFQIYPNLGYISQ